MGHDDRLGDVYAMRVMTVGVWAVGGLVIALTLLIFVAGIVQALSSS